MLALERLSVTLPLGEGGTPVPVLEEVSLTLGRGERLGVVGESGSGKTLLALAILGLLPEGALASGTIRFDGVDLLTLASETRRAYRGRRIGMVFQEPMTALHPMLTIGDQIGEGIALHQGLRGAALRQATLDLLAQVQVPEPARRIDSYPHELSGGQRQRVGLAVALSGNPDLLIADEPTTALDVTVQRQILALLHDLTEARGLGLLLVSHDLGVVARLTQRLLVLYAGQAVETGPTPDLLMQPLHPYLKGLRAAVPGLGETLTPIPGNLPTPQERGTGCRFAPRCAFRQPPCTDPQILRAQGARTVACWQAEALG
ncbi:ABC transporter ATP-binding protein [Elstera sp.]|jgi:oligopeptide/dipeptide ABC transporter ATP-binding protein|uniref:ABC transporter ATP-binding protein n=1 Tax=Elstera sp. TaxID=1916664 RepID=UPI0037C0781A